MSASPIGGIVTLFDPKAGTSSVAAGGLDYPLDAVLKDDSLLVAEAGTGRLLRIPLADPASRVVVADGLGAPAGVATRGDTTWVTDAAGGRVFQISRTGQVRLVATGLARPQGIAVRGGELVVVESGTGRVTALKLGSQRRRTPLHGLTPANPPLPGRPTDGIYFGVAVNTAGTVFVSDPFTNRVLSVRHR